MKPKDGTKKGSEIMNTHTHTVLIPEVLEEDGVTSGVKNVNITEGVSDIWAERRSGGPHIHGFGFFNPSWNFEYKNVFFFFFLNFWVCVFVVQFKTHLDLNSCDF